MNYVYDASFIIAIILPDEDNYKTDIIHDALDDNDDVYIPQLNWYETANVFRNLIRHKRFTADEAAHFFSMLSFVNFKTDFESGVNYSKKIWELACNYNLSAYDAAYLELAERKKAVLCTLDDGLLKAAIKHGVKVAGAHNLH